MEYDFLWWVTGSILTYTTVFYNPYISYIWVAKCSLWPRSSSKKLLHCASLIVAKVMWQMPSGITMRFLHKSHSLWADSSGWQLVKSLGASALLVWPPPPYCFWKQTVNMMVPAQKDGSRKYLTLKLLQGRWRTVVWKPLRHVAQGIGIRCCSSSLLIWLE